MTKAVTDNECGSLGERPLESPQPHFIMSVTKVNEGPP